MIAITKVAELVTSDNQASYTLGTFTPAANSILYAIVVSSGSDGSTLPTLTDTEGTWTRKRSDFLDAGVRGCHIFWRKVGGSPVEISPLFDAGADSLTGCMAAIHRVIPDVMPSGDPIRQIAFNGPVTSADPNVTFAANLLNTNGYIAHSFNGINPYAMTAPPTDWTQTVDSGHAAPAVGIWTGYREGGETGTVITATRGSTSGWHMWGAEIWNEDPSAVPIAAISVGYHLRGINR